MLAQILALSAATLGWDAALHWSGFDVSGKHPVLRYANNPDTDSVNECEQLPGYGNTTSGLARCGDLLPGQ